MKHVYFVLHGLKLSAVAVVMIALLGMRKALCPCWPEMLMAVAALVILFMAPLAWIQPLVILMGGVIGIFIFKHCLLLNFHVLNFLTKTKNFERNS